ncbi:MAG: SAM-dependent methyltransferase [Trebonia sp.]
MTELPSEIDTSRPHSARVYDYYLGGKNHFAADRETADKVLAAWPHVRVAAREQRKFLGRAVRYLAKEAGIRQFMDIGTGLPITNSVHEIAQRTVPQTRVLYVDNDPLVLAHARALLTSSPEGRTVYMHADFRQPESILKDPVTQDILDFGRPLALVLVGLLHLVPDADDPARIIATLVDALPSGSYLVSSHLTAEHDQAGTVTDEGAGASAGVQTFRNAGMRGQLRDSDDFARLAFTGLELMPPGVVLVSEWHPNDPGPGPKPGEVSCYGAVARKP